MWTRIGRWTTFGVVLALVSAALSACQREQESMREDAEASRTEIEAFVVADPPHLDITGNVGDITVRRGEYEDRVMVEYTLTAFGRTEEDAEEERDAMRVRIWQEDSAITIDAHQPSKTNQHTNEVNLLIDVPSTLALAITHTTGNIHVQDVRIDGPLRIQNFTGDVNVLDVIAPAGLNINHSMGSATFEGEIGDRGKYAIQLITGTISVHLPDTATVQFDADTTVGAVSYEGPDLSGETLVHFDAGTTFTGQLGATDGPTLSLRLTTGDIRITITGEEEEE